MMKRLNELSEKFTYRVEWSQEDQVHIARCLEFPSLKAHGNSAKKALEEIESVVSSSIQWMQEEGEKIPEPFRYKAVQRRFNASNSEQSSSKSCGPRCLRKAYPLINISSLE